MTSQNAWRIGNCVGHLLAIDDFNQDALVLSKYQRIRVEIDLTKPILPSFHLNRDRIWKFGSIHYERLGDVCYNYGLFGHNKRCCPQLSTNPINEMYGSSYGQNHIGLLLSLSIKS